MTTVELERRLPAAPLAEARSDVLFAFGHVTWADARRRAFVHAPDRLADGLTRHPRVGRLVIADPYRSLPVRVARMALGAPHSNERDGEGWQHCRPWRMRRHDPASIRGLSRTYRAYDERLRRAANRAGLRAPAVITTNPMLAGFAPLTWARSVTYYAIDDWVAHPTHARWAQGHEVAYARLRRDPDRRVCAVSRPLMERIAPAGPSQVVANGLDPDEWKALGAPAPWVTGLPRPMLVYVGTLDTRLDLTAIRGVADAYAEGSVVLVGRCRDDAVLEPLRSRPNVHVRHPVSRRELIGLVGAADAGLVPHVQSDLTSAMSPLKLYEYLAGGLPVAATDLEPMRRVHDRVALAASAASFPEAVARALDAGRLPEAERMRFVAKNSWHRRHDAILDFALA